MISACPKAGCYAVLASLSKRYPPLEGRSPTCYSPVCHSTCGRSRFRVRLACVRHAASVDSEPGSNSHVKFAVLGLSPSGNSFNARSFLALLRCFGYVKCCGCAPALTNQDTRRLILDGSLCPPPPASALARFGETSARLVCACTHYLVFKEPAASPPISRRVPRQPSVREPFDVTASGFACQPLIQWRPIFSFGAPTSDRRLGNLTRVSTPGTLVNTFLR